MRIIVLYCLLIQFFMHQIVHSCKSFKPPAYPKREKASTVRLDLPRNTHIPHANKIQREENISMRSQEDSPGSKRPPSIDPAHTDVPSQCPDDAQKSLRRQDYHQFSRKNYFKTRRNIEQTEAQSRLTEKVVPKSMSGSQEHQKRLKSKSALNYAKYFIKHVSIIPTQPSSNTNGPQADQSAQCPQEEHKKNEETSTQKKSASIFSHEDRQKSRNKISERLKSIKNIRNKAKKKTCSIQKQKEPQQTPSKPVKIAGNIDSLETNQSNVLRMKARARNKRIILKVKRFHSRVRQQDIFLMVSSKIDRSFSQRREVIEKIQLHLELLNFLPAYVKEFKEIYEQSECWEELIFLVYKKFYTERLKVQLALGFQPRNGQELACSNPFRFNFCQLSYVNLEQFKNSIECIRLQQKLSQQNISIKEALRNLYNHIIEKSGKHVNLYQVDNFSQEIYYLMNEEFKLLTENQVDSLQTIRERRIGFIIKSCLMIAFLNGERVQMDSILTQNSCTQKMKDTYHAFIQYYTA